jgi:hypothetical protein
MKRWLLNKMIDDFDVFMNLRNAGVDITVSVIPDVVEYGGKIYRIGNNRNIEVRTETPEQETLMLLAVGGYVTLIEERTESW